MYLKVNMGQLSSADINELASSMGDHFPIEDVAKLIELDGILKNAGYREAMVEIIRELLIIILTHF